MSAERYLGRLEKESPLAVRLAEAVSLAVLVDPPLLRRARRELVPEADPGIEADLWTSSLVQTRSPDGLVFHPEVAQALRERLRDSGRLDEAWNLTRHLHGHFSPALKLEEEIAWLSVSPSPDAAARIEDLLRSALAALVAGERRGLAHWAARALPRLPAGVRLTETARILDAGARLRLNGDARSLPESKDHDWIVPADLPRVPVRVRLLEGAVELDAGSTGGTMLQLPQTDPLLVNVSWEEGGEEKARQAIFRKGGKVPISVPTNVEAVRLRTVLGEVYDLRAAGRPGGRMRDWIIDFSEERARHRPFFGRERELEEIQRWIQQGRKSGRTILIHGRTGEGKTALLSRLIEHLADEGRMPPHHFFQRGSRADEMSLAERSLRAQLAEHLPQLENFAAHLRLPELFEHLSPEIERALDGSPLVFVLDALDEAWNEMPGLEGFLPERLPADIVVVASARSDALEGLRLPEPVTILSLGDSAQALHAFWENAIPAPRRSLLRVTSSREEGRVSNEELTRASDGNFGFARVLERWLRSGWLADIHESLPDIQGVKFSMLWMEAELHLGGDLVRSWLGTLAAARQPLPVETLIGLLGMDDFARTRESPFERMVVGEGYYLVEEILREKIASSLDLTEHHRRLAEVAAEVLNREVEMSSFAERRFALLNVVHHWLAAGEREKAVRWVLQAARLIAKGGEAELAAMRRDFIDVMARAPERDRDSLAAILTVLNGEAALVQSDPEALPSLLYTRCVTQGRQPEEIRAILQLRQEEPPLRPKLPRELLIRPGSGRRHRSAVVGCRFLERRGTVPAILSWTVDGTLQLWELDSGEMIRTFTGHTAKVTGAVLLGPEKLLTSSSGGTLRLWTLGENPSSKILGGHEGEVLGVLGLSDRRAVSWSVDRTIRIWDVEAGREELILRGHEGAVTDCAVTPNGWYLLSGSADATVRQWELSSGGLAGTWSGHTGPVTAVAAGEGFFVSAATDGTVRAWPLWASHSFEPMILMTHGLGVLGCTVLGGLVASWAYDQTIRVRRVNLGLYSDVRSSVEPVILRGHTAAVLSCAFFPDGDRLVSASADGTLRIWDLATGETLHVLEGHAGPVRSVGLFAEQIVSASDDRTLRVWNAESGEEIAVLDGDNETRHCIALQDRRQIVTWSRMGDLKIYHVDSNESPRWLGSPSMAVGGALVTSDDRRLILWSRGLVEGQARIAVWDLEQGKEIRAFGGPESPVVACAATPDGSLLVNGCANGSLHVYREKGQSFRFIPAHTGRVSDIKISLSGEFALTASWDGTLRRLDLHERSVLSVVGRHKDRILACAIDLDGRLAVTASADRTLHIWDIEEGSGPLLAGHEDQVTGCAFTWDGTRVVSCSLDSTLGIWDVRTGALLHRLRGHQDWVNAFVIDDDRGVIYSCSEDRTVRAWDLESGEQRGVVYGVSPFRSLALTYDGVAAGDEAGNFWALEFVGPGEEQGQEAELR